MATKGYSAPKGSPKGGATQTSVVGTGGANRTSGAPGGQTTYSSTGNAGAATGASKRPTVVSNTNQPMPPGPIAPPTKAVSGNPRMAKGVGAGAVVPVGNRPPTTAAHIPMPRPAPKKARS